MKRIGLLPVLLLLAGACAPSDDASSASPDALDTQGVVDVVARGLTLEAPDEIPSGWTTFRFRNESSMIHFALVERVPDGQGIESQQAEVAPVFQDGLDLLGAGQVDDALQRFGDLPAWFGEIVFLGGPGLTSPGRTSQATVYLEPGTYLLECYVKTGGVFHSFNPDPSINGMVHEFTVTDELSEAVEPTATLQIEISAAGGIEAAGDLVPGEHTVAVHFVDQTVHANFVGHDVHLVRVTDDLDLEALERWMDWSLPMGLQSPAPALFLGGSNEMPAGTTGYFTVVLEAGDYAWVSEVSRASEKGMLEPFSVRSTTEDTVMSRAERRVDYLEFLTTNMGETQRFYSGVFGWEFTDYGPDYASFNDGRLDGGFAVAPEVVAGGPLVVFYAIDLEGIEARIREHGGQIVKETFEFPGGRRFHFTDPAGNELAVWSDQ